MRALIILLIITLCPLTMWGQFDPENPGEPSLVPPVPQFWQETFLNQAKFHNQSKDATRYEWDFGDGSAISKEKDPLHNYTNSGTYKVKLTAINGSTKVSIEQEVTILSRENWKLDRTLYLSKKRSELGCYQNMDTLFTHLVEIPWEYNVSVSVERGENFELSSFNLMVNKDILINRIKNSGMNVFNINTFGSGAYQTSLKFSSLFNKLSFNILMEILEYVQISSEISVQLGNESIYLSYLNSNNKKQDVCFGKSSYSMRYQYVCSKLVCDWKLKSVPQNVTGYAEIGTGELPEMRLTNASDSIGVLEYVVTFKQGQEVYYTTTYTINVLPSKVSLTDFQPADGGIVDNENSVTISFGKEWWTESMVCAFYIWEDGQEEATKPYQNFFGQQLIIDNFCKQNKTYKWKIAVLNCNELYSDVYSFTVSECANLEVSSVIVPLSLQSSDKITVKAEIRNVGKKATSVSYWTDKLYLSQEAVFNENTARPLAIYEHNGTLGIEEQYEATFTVRLPRQEGTNYLFVKTDINHQVKEDLKPENNVGSTGPVTIQLAEIERVEEMLPSNQGVVYEPSINFTWKTSEKVKKYDFYLWISGTEEPQQPLQSGLTTGTYLEKSFCEYNNSYLWKVVGYDEYGDVVSRSEVNKISVLEKADLQVKSIFLSEHNLVSAERSVVKALIVNRGKKVTSVSGWTDELFLSKDSIFDRQTAQLLDTYMRVGALDSTAQYDAEFTFSVPRNEGKHYLFVKTDKDKSVSEDMYPDNNIQRDSIVIQLAPLTKVENMLPANKDVLSTTTVTFSWRGNTKVKSMDLYAWEVGNPEPTQPLVRGLKDIMRYTNSDFCVFDKSYAWKLCGYDEYGIQISEGVVDSFSIKATPNLHVTNIDSDEAWAGKELTVSWTVKNDGKESTGDVTWKDNVWLVPDISEGIASGKSLSMDNVKKLSPGEAYTNTGKFMIGERISGKYYVVVASDMENIYSIDWAPVEGNAIPDPYTPDVSGIPYPYLKAGAGYKLITEAGEMNGRSDNFFYKKINIQLSALPDLQVVSVVAPEQSLGGQHVRVQATVINKGEAATRVTSWYDEVFISKEPVFDADKVQSLGVAYHEGILEVDKTYTTYFDVQVPARYSGDCYFFVKTDKNNNVYEHAGSENNTSVSEKPINVIISPTADLEVLSLEVPVSASTATLMYIKGKAKNSGVVTDSYSWCDYVFASENPNGLDATASRIAVIPHYGLLKNGQEYDMQDSCSIRKLKAGNYYIYLQVNGDNGVSELENMQGQNVLRSTSTVHVEHPDLFVTDVVIPDTLIAGKIMTLSWTVQNDGADIENYPVTDEVIFSTQEGKKIQYVVVSHKLNMKKGTSVVFTEDIYIPRISDIGKYNVSVRVNAYGDILESNKDNNLSVAKSIQYERYEYEDGKPVIIEIKDLAIQSDFKPLETMTSQEYPVFWNVENHGDAACTKWQTYFYLSKDSIFNQYDSHLLKVIEGTTIVKDGRYMGETRLLIPDEYYEMKYLFLQTAIDYDFRDANMQDNRVAIPLNLLLSPIPDLKVKSIQIPTLISGKTASIVYEIENIGAGSTHVAEWMDAVYLTSSTSFKNEKLMAEKIIKRTLAPGETYKETIQFKVPADYNGNYSLFLKTDVRNAIFELNNKVDNIGQEFVEVISPTLTPVELIATDVVVPASYQVGEQADIAWKVRNTSAYPAIGQLKDGIYLSRDDKWDVSDLLVGTVSEEVMIQPGETVERVAKGIINSVVPGSYYVIIRTNQLNAIKETNYEDNEAVTTTVCRVDFPELPVGGTVSMSGQGFYKLNAQAGETLLLHLEADGMEKGFNLYTAHERVATVTEYDYSSVQPNDPYQEILIPEMKNGTYYILAQQQNMVSGVENNFTLKAETATPERLVLNLSSQLLQFGISSIKKAEGGNNGSATSSIMGAKFDSIMDYRLVRDGKILPAEAVYFQHSSESLVTFNLNEAPTGTYDVVIEKNGGMKTETKSGYTVVTDAPNKLLTKIIASSSMRLGTKNPVTIEYSNEGLSDVSVSELLLVSEKGHPIGLTLKDLSKGETELHIPLTEPGTNKPASVAPGEKGTITIYVEASATLSISLQLYVVQ